MKMKWFVVVLLCLVISGCATIKSTRVLSKIDLGMTEEEVRRRLGEPTVARGAIINKYGQKIKVWEYRLDKGKRGSQLGTELTRIITSLGKSTPMLLSEGDISDYWLYFFDDKLVRWGQAGDWQRESDKIYEINFDSELQLTK